MRKSEYPFCAHSAELCQKRSSSQLPKGQQLDIR